MLNVMAFCRGTRAAGIVAAAGALEGYSQVSNSDGTVSLACEACMAILLRACDMYQDATPWVALLQQAAALAFFQANAVSFASLCRYCLGPGYQYATVPSML